MNDADSPELEKSGMEPELGGLHKGLSEDRQLAELLNDDRLVAGSFSHTKNWEPIRGNKRMKARLMSLVEDDIQEDKVRVLAARLMGFISYKDFAVVQVLGRALSDSDVKWEESTAGEKGWRLRTNLVSKLY